MAMERTREFNKPLFMCFIDSKKAYDSVNRELLWEVCLRYGISKKLVNLLKILYKDSIGIFKINGKVLVSCSLEIKAVVMQGGISLLILFNILFDFIVRKVIDEAAVSGVKFSYGRNLVAMCETAADREAFIRSFEKVTQQFGLTISIKKIRLTTGKNC